MVALGEDAYANYTDHPVTNPRTGAVHNGWTPVMLDTLKQLGVTPDFVIYHRYEQGPGGESDLFLLNSAASWANDAAAIRQMLDDYLGPKARRVELACTEHNSVFSNPGKQTTSLVNGLFYADAIGNLMKTEFNAMLWWDLRNGQEAGNNNSASLYGWRRYGDYGIVNAADPAGPGRSVSDVLRRTNCSSTSRAVARRSCRPSSDYSGLGVYAVKRGSASRCAVLVINKHPTAALNATISIPGLKQGEKANVYSYGIAQDEAARTGEGSADVQQSTLTLQGSTLTFSPGPYSVHVDSTELNASVASHDAATTIPRGDDESDAFDPEHRGRQTGVSEMRRERAAQREVRAGFAHRGAGLDAVATERGDPEKTSRRGIEPTHEPTVGNEGAQARPGPHRSLDPHRRGPFDAIDRNRDVEFFGLHIVRPNGVGIGG